MLGFYVAQPSGGHLNPVVTFVNCLYRGHPWRKFPIYFMGQLLGAMAGAFIVYGNYYHAVNNFEGGTMRTVVGDTATAGIFCTYPAEFMTRESMFWSEFVASSILIFVIFSLIDPKGGNAGKHMPIALFFLIFGIGACFGWETGYAINLARDFGPRLTSYIVGYGHEVWSTGGYYFWVSRNRKASVAFAWLICHIDPHGRSLLRWIVRRSPVRCLHLHRREPHQHALHGPPEVPPPHTQGVVQHLQGPRDFESLEIPERVK